jgi:hypothetical protein
MVREVPTRCWHSGQQPTIVHSTESRTYDFGMFMYMAITAKFTRKCKTCRHEQTWHPAQHNVMHRARNHASKQASSPGLHVDTLKRRQQSLTRGIHFWGSSASARCHAIVTPPHRCKIILEVEKWARYLQCTESRICNFHFDIYTGIVAKYTQNFKVCTHPPSWKRRCKTLIGEKPSKHALRTLGPSAQ